ncbi:MAG: hypothetical protein AAGA54_29165 [Myxococcota bacterium]
MRRFVTLSIGLGVVALLGTMVVLTTGRTRLPEPMVTAADLPALPPAEENGWTALAAFEDSDIADLPGEQLVWLLESQSEESAHADRWDALAGEDSEFSTPLPSRFQRALRTWRQMAAAPVFVDGCMPDPTKVCPHLQFYKLHQLALIDVAQQAVAGDWAVADRRLAAALRLDYGLLSTNRNAMSAAVAVNTTAEALALTHLLMLQAPDRVPATIEAARRFDDVALQAFDVRHRSAIGTYLFEYAALRRAHEQGSEVLVGEDDWRPDAMLDIEASAALIDASYVRFRREYGPSLVVMRGDEADDEAVGCGWFASVRNSIGCDVFASDAMRKLRARSMETLETDLEPARRWAQRIRDLQDAHAVDSPEG